MRLTLEPQKLFGRRFLLTAVLATLSGFLT
jgi:hypothetical protein